ncbi:MULTISPECIES: hypothetical protein [Bacillaceae]|uniref:hypothetical protein n=1 Tax=Bacillaceae TaxID=186817 RepID=UPI000BFDFC05|nr:MULTISPECIES: hypothetical protein [Bacillaceae]PGT84831.1 hypothetical protein COD11_10070 [Bacillus sp. AFS040349]UGB29030.1 hypothetical protein LPC09_14810 [Metabacillus sp. B2-18]
MLYLIAGIIFIVLIGSFFKRSISIKNVPCVDIDHHDQSSQVVDVRDYNNLSTMKNFDSIVIPIAYLRRYFHEIPNKRVHLIAGNQLEKNMGVRFLQKNGFQVTGYSLTECTCTNHSKDMLV